MSEETLGFIGLGVMGEPMCRNLVTRSGRKLLALDTRPEPLQRLSRDGAEVASSVADMARRADTIFLSLPGEKEVRAVCLGPDGLVAGTERTERWLFWPMGIESAGAMRQWGRHATAFVGRRHFDDHDLVERRFELP